MKATTKKKPATPARTPAKGAVKTSARAAVKPTPKAKSAPKTAARPAAKSTRPATTPAKPVKSVTPSKPVKPVAKAVAKPVAASKAAPTRPVPKKAAPPKAAAKPVAKKASVKPAAPAAGKKAVASPVPAKTGSSGKPAKPETKSVIKAIPKTPAQPESKTSAVPSPQGVKVSAIQAAAPAIAQPGGLLPRPPLKPGRRSSARIASQSPPPAPMLPTHAPDAAKASYSIMAERVIAPPPQAAAKKDPKLANNWKTKAGEELTDDEVKAMPDAEYMNDKQMAFFRHKLSVLKQEIHNSAGETTEHLREDTVVVPDPADRATIEEEHALELRTRDRERKLLKKIEQSIARIDSGDYGYCDETGEAIGVGRLIARPTANLSLEAQQRRELKQKMFGD